MDFLISYAVFVFSQSQEQAVLLEVMMSYSDGSTVVVTIDASPNDDIFAKSQVFCSKINALDLSECSYRIYFSLETQLMKKCDNSRIEQCINTSVPDRFLEENQRQWENAQMYWKTGQVAKYNEVAFGDHYRSFVGPIIEYGSKASSFFVLLATFGLEDEHRLLDVGCGSLRLGRLLIPFLNRGHYFCLEPNSWLHNLSIQYELGKDILHLKKPTFINHSNFSVPENIGSMDFIFVNSIFSHTAPDLLGLAVENLAKVMHERSVLLATFFVEGFSTFDSVSFTPVGQIHALRYDQEGLSGWYYDDNGGAVTYEEDFLHSFFGKYSLFLKRITFPHSSQTWYAIARDKEYLENLVTNQ